MKNNKYIIYILLGLALTFFFIMNAIVPYFGDDYGFMYMGDGRRIGSLWEAIKRTGEFYLTWNGRLLPNLFGFALTSLVSDSVFNVLNTLIYALVLFEAIIYLWDDKKDIGVIGISVLIVGLFCINTHDVFYWAIGSVNYLWPLPFFFLLLILIERSWSNKLILPIGAYLPLGFFLSLTHEVYVLPLSGVLGVSIIYLIVKKQKNLSFFLLSIGVFMGLLVLMLSPGVLMRFGIVSESTSSVLVYIGKLFVNILMELRIFYLLALSLIIFWAKDSEFVKDFVRKNAFLLILVVMGLVPAVLVSSGGRTLMCTELCSVLVIARLLQIRWARTNSMHLVLGVDCGVLILMIVVAIFSYYNWNVYRESEKAYLNSEGSTVIIDDSHNYAAYLLPGYIVNLDERYNAVVKVRLKKEKQNLLQLDTCAIMEQVPYSVIECLEDEDQFLNSDNIVKGSACFYTNNDINYYVARYDDVFEQKYSKGVLSFKYSLPFFMGGEKLYVNVPKDDLSMPMSYICLEEKGSFIVFRKSFHKFPFTKIEEINLIAEPGEGVYVVK